MTIAPGFVDRLKSQINVSDVVSKKVKLTKKGKDYFGRCPFHNEDTPSFSVNDVKRFYHCFGCGANGDIISFVEKTQNMQFNDAVEYLAKEYNIPLPIIDKSKYRAEVAVEKINEEAAKWFQKQLYSGAAVEVLKYLNDRGIRNDAIKRFQIGFAPSGRNNLIQHLHSLEYKEKDLKGSGLITILESGEVLDKFRNRVIFPISNFRGRVVGFGGRALGDAKPKYLNSPETEVFKKKHILYNEDKLFNESRNARDVYVFEGYTDVVSSYISGIKNVVATLGTSVSEFHIQKLWKISDCPTICMDGDLAGLKAMKRAIDVVVPILKPGYSVSFIKLPEGLDPDDVLKIHGKEQMINILDNKKNLCDAIWDVHIEKADLSTPEKQALFKKELFEVTGKIQDESVKKFYNKYFSDKLYQEFTKKSRKYSKASKPTVPKVTTEFAPKQLTPKQLTPLDKYIFTLLAIIIDTPYILTKSAVHEEFFSIESDREYFNKIHLAIVQSFDKCNLIQSEYEFNKEFAEQIKSKLNAPVIDYLTGKNSYFLDKISVKNINNVLTSWEKTFARYNLELLKADYIKSLHAMDESSTEISARLKKQIHEQEERIKTNSN